MGQMEMIVSQLHLADLSDHFDDTFRRFLQQMMWMESQFLIRTITLKLSAALEKAFFLKSCQLRAIMP